TQAWVSSMYLTFGTSALVVSWCPDAIAQFADTDTGHTTVCSHELYRVQRSGDSRPAAERQHAYLGRERMRPDLGDEALEVVAGDLSHGSVERPPELIPV